MSDIRCLLPCTTAEAETSSCLKNSRRNKHFLDALFHGGPFFSQNGMTNTSKHKGSCIFDPSRAYYACRKKNTGAGSNLLLLQFTAIHGNTHIPFKVFFAQRAFIGHKLGKITRGLARHQVIISGRRPYYIFPYFV